jgi:hypothetical protein
MANFSSIRRFVHHFIYLAPIESDITFRQDVGLDTGGDLQAPNGPTATRKKGRIAKIIDNAWKETDVYKSLNLLKSHGLSILDKVPDIMNMIGEATNVAMDRRKLDSNLIDISGDYFGQ